MLIDLKPMRCYKGCIAHQTILCILYSRNRCSISFCCRLPCSAEVTVCLADMSDKEDEGSERFTRFL